MESTFTGGASICRDVPTSRKRVKKEPPVLDAPSGMRDPRAIHADKLGLVRTWCGPWVLMAITGRPLEDIRAVLNLRRGRAATEAVKGTGTYEMTNALTRFGWRAERQSVDYKTSFAATLRKRTSEQMAEVWLVCAGNHWHLVKGRKVTCAILKRWTWISHATKRRAPVMSIHRLSKLPNASELRAATLTTVKKTLRDRKATTTAASREAASRSRAKKAATAEGKRLGATFDIEGRGTDLWINVYPPEGKHWVGWGGVFGDSSWEAILQTLRGMTDADLEPDPDYEDEE